MAITPAHKTPRGYEVQPVREFLFISEGASPKIPKGEVATYLPIKQFDEKVAEGFVILSGTVVARDANGQLVFCNGGTAVNLTYTATDIGRTVNIDAGNVNNANATLVTAAGVSVAQVAANRPIGIAAYHWYSGALRLRYKNYELQPDVSILNRGLIEIPIVRTAQNALDEGDLLKSDSAGYMVRWVHGVDDVSQIVGRVIWRDQIASYPGREELSMVRSVRGIALAGAETGGIPGHLYAKAHQAGGNATSYIRVNLTLL